ncbi:MAG: argininosuccinate lyase [Candidatus Sumerlaeia bacterium]|nr:argininosuccinate lyase [Candidatus Sumerlaeia bacterium]
MSSSPAPVWSKRVGEAALAELNIGYCAGYDVVGREAADKRLAPYDLRTNAAHLLMLHRTGIVPTEKAAPLAKALLQIQERMAAGEDFLLPSAEDIHMSLEIAVGEIAGSDVSGHLHTARSRNDQVATDMRLWLREETARLGLAITALAADIAEHARAHVESVCPGFTHGQPAMVTSWGHWTMSYLPRLLRVVRQLPPILRDLKTCPLGAAASFGTAWPIDRVQTSQLLGFEHPTPSGADGIWSRGELESRFAFAVAQLMGQLSGIGQDMILLSTPPRAWLRLGDEHVTGSSIMPQKRNPDFAEVTRSRAAVAQSIVQAFMTIATALPSGYNRDTQWTKYLVFDAADNGAGACEIFSAVFRKMDIDKAAMRQACDIGFLNATDVADMIARTRKVPFRSTYRILGPAVKDCEAEGRLVLTKLNKRLDEEGIAPLTEEEWRGLEFPEELLKARSQPGNPSPEETTRSIGILLGEIEAEAGSFRKNLENWSDAGNSLLGELNQLAQK